MRYTVKVTVSAGSETDLNNPLSTKKLNQSWEHMMFKHTGEKVGATVGRKHMWKHGGVVVSH